MKRRRFWCAWCKQRALFPTLHFVVHILDTLSESAREANANGSSDH